MLDTRFLLVLDLIEKLVNMPPPTATEVAEVFPEEKATNAELCRRCRGRCCKTCGCHFSPSDFKKVDYQTLKRRIEKGDVAICYVRADEVNGNVGAYILRIRNYNEPVAVPLFGNNHGICRNLTTRGCKLSFSERPSGGKFLIPTVDKRGDLDCYNAYDIESACMEWQPYHELLGQLYREYEEKELVGRKPRKKCSFQKLRE